MRLVNMLKKEDLLKYAKDEKSLKRCNLDSYKKEKDRVFVIETKRNNEYKIRVHNYYENEHDGRIAWCYSAYKKVNGIFQEEYVAFPKVVGLIGSIMVFKQRSLMPEVRE